jgi:hypothetical protein
MLLFLSLVDITDGGRLVTEGIIHPVVNVSALTWFARYFYYWYALITFIRYDQYRNTGKPNNLAVFGSNKRKSLNGIANIGCSHLCLRERDLSFHNNYIIKELHISIIKISSKPCQCRKMLAIRSVC